MLGVMGFNTGIEWTDHTWGPWQGCHKVSMGCLHCYMFRDKRRYGQNPDVVIRSKPPTFNAPLKWKEPARVFVCQWSDFFIEEADAWRGEAWEIMRRTPHLTFQILTKRPENIRARLPRDWPLENVWLGVTVENQEMMEERIPYLFIIEPEIIKFLSIEPMLGEIRLYDITYEFIDWIIVGGETGPRARPMSAYWAYVVKNACACTKTPFFFKQMSGREPIPDYLQGREFPDGK